MSEVEHQFSHIYIPENKESAWVYSYGLKKPIKKDLSKEHQGIWVEPHNVTALKPSPLEVWVFLRDEKTNHLEIANGVLDNNPYQGKVGYDPNLDKRENAKPEQMWFYPPKVNMPKGIKNAGVWIKPEFKRDMSKLGNEEQGFFAVSKNYNQTGGKLGVSGGWKTFGAQEFVKIKNSNNTTGGGKSKTNFMINVRTHKGEVFPIQCLPGHKFMVIKNKIEKLKRIPIIDQRLAFEGIDLIDIKTISGSGVKNNDTIDLLPMHIFVRNVKGKKYKIDNVEHDEQITEIMKRVQDIEGTPIEKQILSFKRVQMKPGKNLSSYNVKHRSTIDLSGMIIYVELLSGEKIELDTEPTELIQRIKAKVKNRTQIPIQKQHLYYDGKHINLDKKDLNFYNIKHLDTLVMADNKPSTEIDDGDNDGGGGGISSNNTGMKIFIVKDWDKKKFVLHVTPKTYIEEIKQMIEKKENIPINEQRLTFKKKSVYNKKTLEQSKIKHNNILHLSKLGQKTPTSATTSTSPDNKVKDDNPDIVFESKKPPDDQTAMKSPTEQQPEDDDDDEPTIVVSSKTKPPTSQPPPPPPKQQQQPTSPSSNKNDDNDNNDVVDDDEPVVTKTKKKKPVPKKRRNSVPLKKQQPTSPNDDDDNNNIGDDDPVVTTKKKTPPKRSKSTPLKKVQPKKPSSQEPNNDNDNNIGDDDPVVTKKKPPKRSKSTPLKKVQPKKPSSQEPNDNDNIGDDDPVVTKKKPPKRSKSTPLKKVQPKKPTSQEPTSPNDDNDDIGDDDPAVTKKKPVPKKRRNSTQKTKRPSKSAPPPQQPTSPTPSSPNDKDDNPSKSDNSSIPNNNKKPNQSNDPSSSMPDDDDDEDGPFYRPRQDKQQKDKPPGAPSRTLSDIESDSDDDSATQIQPKKTDTMGPPEIEIAVKTPNGSKVYLKFPPDKKLEDVKEEIEDKTGIKKHGVRIFYIDGDEEIPDDTRISKIKPSGGNDDLISIEVRPPEIEVEIPNHGRRTFIFDPDDTVEDLTKEISRQLGEPPGHRLLRNGEELDDDVNVPDAIRPGDVFTLEPNEIEIELPDGGKTKINLLPNFTLDDVKDIIEEKCGLPKKAARLFFLDNDKELDDDETPITEMGVKSGTQLKLRPPKVKVKGPGGKSRVFPVQFDDTGKDFKKRVRKKMGFPPDQRILLNDEELVDDEKMIDSLHHGDILTTAPPGVEITTPKGKVYLQPSPVKSIGDIKHDIEKETGIPSRSQRIFFMDDEIELPDDTPFSKTRFKSEMKLEMKSSTVEVMEPTGKKSRPFFLDPDDTIKDLKKKYFSQPAPGKRLFLDGNELDDDEKLTDCLHHGDILTTEPNEVEIELPNRKVFLSILPSDDIDKIKEKIEEKAGIKKKAQRLFFFDDDKELGGDVPASKVKTKGNSLKLRPPKIKVTGPGSKSRVFAMDFEETGKEFRDRATAKLGLKLGQPLYFDGEQLDDDTPIVDCLHHGQIVTTEPPKSEVENPPRDKANIEITPPKSLQATEGTGKSPVKSRNFNFDPCEVENVDVAERRRALLGLDPAKGLPDIDPPDEDDHKSSKSRNFHLSINPEEEQDAEAERKRALLGLDPAKGLPGIDPQGDEDRKSSKSRNFHLSIDPEEEQDDEVERRRALLGLEPAKGFSDIDSQDDDDRKSSKSRHFHLSIDPEEMQDDEAERKRALLGLEAAKGFSGIGSQGEDKDGGKPSKSRHFHLSIDPEEEQDDEAERRRALLGLDPAKGLSDIDSQDEGGDDRKSSKSRHFHLSIDPEEEQDDEAERRRALLGLDPAKGLSDIDSQDEDGDDRKSSKSRHFHLSIDPEEGQDDEAERRRALLGLDPAKVLSDIDPHDDPHDDGVQRRSKSRNYHLSVDPVEEQDADGERQRARLGLIPAKRLPGIDLHEEEEDEHKTARSRTFSLMIDPEESQNDDAQTRVAIMRPDETKDMPSFSYEKVDEMKISKSRESRNFYMDNDDDDDTADEAAPRQKVRPSILGQALKQTPIKIVIEQSNGERLSLTVAPNIYFDDLKEEVEYVHDIPVEHQMLRFEDEPVDETLTLEEAGVRDGSVLFLEGMMIHVDIPEGDRIALSVQPDNTTIENIKEMLFEKVGAATSNQCLLHGGVELDDADNLTQCNVVHNDVLLMEIFEISVMHWLGEAFAVPGVCRDDTVSAVEKAVSRRKKIPIHEQKYRFNGKSVDKSMTLLEQGINHKSVLTMEEPREVEVMLPDRQKLRLTVFDTMTAAEMKDTMKEVIEERIPEMRSRQQRIFFFDNNNHEEIVDENETPVMKLDLEGCFRVEIVTFDITIEHWNGETVMLSMVNPGDYTDDLKERIAEHWNIPIFQQRLHHNGKPVDDSCSLEDQGIQDKSTLVLQPMSIHVLLPEGKKLPIVVEPEYKIKTVKAMLSSQSGIATHDMCLVSGGEEYADDETLLDSRIHHDDVIVLEIFELYVMDWLGETHTLSGVGRDDTINEVKLMISERLNVSMDIDNQRITHNGEQVANDARLSDYGIGHKSILVLISPDDGDIIDIPEASKMSAKMMKSRKFKELDDEIWPLVPDWGERIFFFDSVDEVEVEVDSKIRIMATLLNGEVLTFEMRPTCTVDHIKDKILEKRKHIKKKNYKLKFKGKRLDDKKSLLSQRVGHNSALVMEPLKEKKLEDLPPTSKLQLDVLPTVQVDSKITLQIQHWNGGRFKLAADSHLYIDDIKELIFNEQGIAVDQQRLSFKGRPVDEFTTLEEQSIVNKSRLVLQPMQIHVEADGEMETYSVTLEHTISRLKGMLFSKFGTPAGDQVIMFGSEELEDNKTLEECQVDHDDVLVLESYEISILHWSGQVYPLQDVRRTDTIKTVRKKLKNLTPVPDDQEFKFEGESIDDSLSLLEQKVKHKAILTIEDTSITGVSVPKFERFRVSLFPTGLGSDNEVHEDRTSSTISLVVKHFNGKIFNVEAEPTDYCDDVRDKIEALEKIPVRHQRLSFKGNHVDETLTLKEQKIVDQSRLQLEPMKIQVQVPDGKSMTFEVDPNHTISKLKGQIFSKIGTPASDQAILDGGEELEDSKTLDDCQIDHLDTLAMEVYEISYMLLPEDPEELPGDPVVLAGVRRTDTIARVKKKVFISRKIPMESQRYRLQENPIDESKPLQAQGLKHKSILILEKT